MQKKILVVLALFLATSYATLSSFSVTDTFGSTTAGWPIYGAASDAIKLVTFIGDFNGDSRNDYAIVGGAATSTIYIVLGQSGGRTAALDLGTASATNFLSFALPNTELASGLAAGDINGDGAADLAVGVTGGLKVYVFYGKGATTWTTWAAPTIPITNPQQGFTVTETADFGMGGEHNMAFQDFLGDTKDDLLLGLPGHGTNKGAICVIAGRANINANTGGSTASNRGTDAVNCDSQTSLDNTNKWEGKLIIGAANDKIGKVVAAGTDMTGDGNDDVFVSGDAVATAYIVYGVAKVTATPTATYGPELDASVAGNSIKLTLAGAPRTARYIGDFNGDSKDDLAIGYSAATLGSKVYVLFGQGNKYTGITASPQTLDLTGVAFTSTYGITYSNPTSGDYFGWEVDGADFNSDGISDLLVSAPLADGGPRTAAGAIGKVHIIYGSKSNTAAVNLNTASLNGITISGAAATAFGTSLAAIPGGVSGDSIADFIVSAPSGTKTGATGTGIVYEFRGQAIDPSGSGFKLHFSVLAFASILVALLF